MRIPVLVILETALAMVFPASGQVGMFRTNFSPPYAMPTIAGMPYSAEQVSENKQTLADGTNISQPVITIKMFRDAAGRTRSERPMSYGYRGPQEVPVIVEINDVVAGYRYVLDSVNKVAHRSAIPTPAQRRGAAGGFVGYPSAASQGSTPAPAAVTRPAAPKATVGPPPPGPENTNESLGTQVIEGLTCEGRRVTTTYPTGSMGNDRPMITTSETWVSIDLKVLVLSKRKDPRSGENTMQLKNISRAEPEYSLFQPPSDYKIVDETGPFDITINMAGTQR